MNKHFFFIISMFFALTSGLKAQDTIVLKSGTQILSKISEIGTNGIKYKAQENPTALTMYLKNSKSTKFVFTMDLYNNIT